MKEIVTNIDIKHYSDQLVIDIFVNKAVLGDLCLNLLLLDKNFIKEIALHDSRSEQIIAIVSQDGASNIRAILEMMNNEARVLISGAELSYWLSFFLKYYRDEFAEVDHIDVELDTSRTRESEGYLTFRTADVAPPISHEEVNRRLDL